MLKSLEERIVSFTVEFVKAVARINKDLIYSNYYVWYGKKKVWFENITFDKMTVKDILESSDDDQEEDVREFTEDDDCVACMFCEGYLYEKMYGYSGYQKDIYNDGDEAEKLHDAVNHIAGKYDLWFEWASGALKFYDCVYTTINTLLKYEFYDGEKTECPIAIIGPDGSVKSKFRVYAYGGLIGRIATGKGNTCLADKGYAKYLDIKLQAQLEEMLKENNGGQLEERKYLDIILKAAKKRFLNEGGNLGERQIQTAIVKQHMKNPKDDWCVIDMEYTVSETESSSGQFKPDIVVYDINKGFGLIELKYDVKNTGNLDKHYTDYQNVIQDEEAVKRITEEIKRRIAYLWAYGLISDTIYKSIKISGPQNLWQGFLFVGGERKAAVNEVNRLAEKNGEIKADENCRFIFFPYEEKNSAESINNIKLDHQSMQTYKDFIKE